ncbi:MAG TPA: HAD family phosphatase [Chloroflexota bacterium]|nr:HAD family phosphatase [Chloroflexota bacterium]
MTGPLAPTMEAGIFDVGGVLISNEIAHVWRDVLETLKLEEKTWRPAWRELGPLLGSGQLNEDVFWCRLMEHTGARGALPEESLFLREYRRRWKVHQEVLDLVGRLKASGMKTAVLSNTITAHVTHNRERGLYVPFDVLVFSNEVGASKPDEGIYRHTLKLLGLAERPEAAFFVDDMEENVVAARKMGLHGIVFQDADQLASDLRGLGIEV